MSKTWPLPQGPHRQAIQRDIETIIAQSDSNITEEFHGNTEGNVACVA